MITMADSDKKRISTHKVKIGMVLAADVVTPKGQLLIPSGTEISEKHLFRMNLYQILSATITVPSATDHASDAETSDLDEDFPLLPEEINASERWLNRTESFLRFSKMFGKVEVVVREQFELLASGKAINQEKLLASTQTLMGSVRLKSDLFAYMSHLKSEHDHTYVHSVNVGILCNIFGQWLKYTPQDIEELTLAGILHDIGKLKTPYYLLNKIDPLTPDEFQQLKAHAELGYEMVAHMDTSPRVIEGVRYHHERNDGTGYPLGLSKEAIPDFAKIIAIADVYDAMTSGRSYHKKFSPFKVIQLFEQESYGYLDTKHLLTFLENIAHYYLGERVKLTDGTIGKIVFIHNQSPSKPIIQTDDTMIDLLINNTLSIEEVL